MFLFSCVCYCFIRFKVHRRSDINLIETRLHFVFGNKDLAFRTLLSNAVESDRSLTSGLSRLPCARMV